MYPSKTIPWPLWDYIVFNYIPIPNIEHLSNYNHILKKKKKHNYQQKDKNVTEGVNHFVSNELETNLSLEKCLKSHFSIINTYIVHVYWKGCTFVMLNTNSKLSKKKKVEVDEQILTTRRL